MKCDLVIKILLKKTYIYGEREKNMKLGNLLFSFDIFNKNNNTGNKIKLKTEQKIQEKQDYNYIDRIIF